MIDLTTLAKSRSYSIQSLGSGEPLCMALDPSGMLLAVAFSDKAVLLVDWYSGAVLASIHGHAQSVTALAWTQDCRHLVSTARDGCVFVWKVDQEFSRAMIQRRRELRPVSAGAAAGAAAAAAKKKESSSAPKSTALALLGSSDEDEEESEGDSEKDEKESAVVAVASAVPPLSNGGSSPKSSASTAASASAAAASGGGGALSYRPRVLPSWARSTVVSPESSGSPTELALAAQQLLPSGVSVGPGLGFGLGLGAGGVERSSSLAAGPANPITGTSSGSGSSGVVARGRWAQRIEVDSAGNPIVPVADVSTHKVYGELGTIGVGTMLLDADGDDGDAADGAEGGAPGSTGSARVSRDEADHEGDDEEEEIEEEDDLSSGEEESEASAEAVVAPEDLSGGGVNLRSSLTARHFQKLRDEGKMPGGSGGGAGAAGSREAQQRRDALFRLPQSFHEREAKTTTETREIRAQLRSMGVLDGEGGAASPNPISVAAAPSVDQPASASASAAAATATSAPALSPSAPAKLERAESDTSASLEGSSQSQFVSAESEPSSAMEHAQIPFSNSLTKALPPLPTSPEPPASSSSSGSVAAVPQLGSPPRAHSQQSQSQSQSLASADPTLRASMQALPSQIAQFQFSLQRMLEGFGAVRHALDSRPATDVSASSSSSSSAMIRASSARPTLPPASIQSVSVSLSFSSNVNASGSGGAGGNAPPSATLPFVSPEALEAAMDLDTLEAVYEAQLDTMEALLAQARPQRRQQQQQQQLLVGTGTGQGQAGGAALMLMSGSDSPSPSSQHHTFLTEAAMSPSQQALTLQQSAAITAQLSEMKQMLQRIEATTLSTTQQLSLGLTLSGPNSLPTNAFSRADSK